MKFSTSLALAVLWVIACIWVGYALFEYVVPEGHWTRTPVLMTMMCAAIGGYVLIGFAGIHIGRKQP